MNKLKVALAQTKMQRDFDKNVENCLGLMHEAHSRGAKMLCFPELQFQQFFPRYRRRKEAFASAVSVRGALVKKFRDKAKEYGMVCVLNLYEKNTGRYYDSSPVIDADGSLLGVSRMMHIVQTKHFYEQDYYSPSHTGFKVYDTKLGRVGVVICFDRHFPESYRAMALLGAQVVFTPSANLKDEPLDLFEAELRSAAYQNNLFIALVNRSGREGSVAFCGESMIVDPAGKVLKKAADREELLIAGIDLGSIERARKVRPFLKLRQPEHYRVITSHGR